MMNDIIFNPINSFHKSIIGAIEIHKSCDINILITKKYNIYDLNLIIYNESGEQICSPLQFKNEFNEYNIFSTTICITKPYLYWYYFEFKDCYGKHYIGSQDNLDCYLTDSNVKAYQLNVYKKSEGNLDWFKGKVMYQIMVDRFNKGSDQKFNYCFDYVIHDKWNDIPNYLTVNGKILNNDIFGGNFQGIIDKIPYLKNLNVGIIYLNPIFLSPSNHKYNTANYLEIDPLFGDINKFTELIQELKKANIFLILDGVFGHTGDDSIYFNKYNHFNSIGAYQSKDSLYYNWYRFKHYPDKYDSWWGIETLPQTKYDSSFPRFICDNVIPKWISLGVKGFRLDVVDELDERFVKQINKSIKRNNKDNIVIGEVWEDASNKIAYGKRRSYFDGTELDSVMNYPLKDAIIDYVKNGNGFNLVNTMRNLINNYPKHVLDSMMNILSTHDTERIMTVFSDINFYTLSLSERASFKLDKIEYFKSRSKLKLAGILLYTLPGVPCLYYGDETGLEGFKDPFCRKTMPWNNLDEDILTFYQKLGKIRNDKIFIDGEYKELFLENNVYAFKRVSSDNEEIIIIINNSQYDYKYNIENAYDLLEDYEIFNYVIVHAQTGKIIRRK